MKYRFIYVEKVTFPVKILCRVLQVSRSGFYAFMARTSSNRQAKDAKLRQFSPSAPNLAWASDITYLPTGEGWLYLAGVMDLYSRRIVGFALHQNLEANIAVDALKMAVSLRKPSPGLIHHSDQGCQYKSQ